MYPLKGVAQKYVSICMYICIEVLGGYHIYIYRYTCQHTHISVYMCVMHLHMHTCMYMCTRMCMRMQTLFMCMCMCSECAAFMCMWISNGVCVCVCLCMYVCMCVYKNICLFMHICIRVWICIYTKVYSYRHVCVFLECLSFDCPTSLFARQASPLLEPSSQLQWCRPRQGDGGGILRQARHLWSYFLAEDSFNPVHLHMFVFDPTPYRRLGGRKGPFSNP